MKDEGVRRRAVVADANLLVACVLPLDYSEAAEARLQEWIADGVALYAPSLWSFEAASALRKSTAAELLEPDLLPQVLHHLLALPVQRVEFDEPLFLEALAWAERLESPVAYDASYVALAQHLDADLWTADRRLVERARNAGSDHVHDLLEAASP